MFLCDVVRRCKHSGVLRASVSVCEKVRNKAGEVAVMHRSIINSRVQIKTHTLSDLSDGCVHAAGPVRESRWTSDVFALNYSREQRLG